MKDINDYFNYRSMTAWNTTPCDEAMFNIQPSTDQKPFPTDQEYDDLIKETLNAMDGVFIKFYQKYAAYCGTTMRDLDFPSAEDIFNKFHDYLKRNRAPDCPQRKKDRAPFTYGDFRRMNETSTFSPSNEIPSKRAKSANDGWGDEEFTDSPTSAINQSKEAASDWGDDFDKLQRTSTPRTSLNDCPVQFGNDRQRNFHIDRPRDDGNYRGRGNRARGDRGSYRSRGDCGNRGGYNRDRTDFFRYGGSYHKNSDDGWKKNAESSNANNWNQGTVDDGWGDDADTSKTSLETAEGNKKPETTNAIIATATAAADDDDGWND